MITTAAPAGARPSTMATTTDVVLVAFAYMDSLKSASMARPISSTSRSRSALSARYDPLKPETAIAMLVPTAASKSALNTISGCAGSTVISPPSIRPNIVSTPSKAFMAK